MKVKKDKNPNKCFKIHPFSFIKAFKTNKTVDCLPPSTVCMVEILEDVKLK